MFIFILLSVCCTRLSQNIDCSGSPQSVVHWNDDWNIFLDLHYKLLQSIAGEGSPAE